MVALRNLTDDERQDMLDELDTCYRVRRQYRYRWHQMRRNRTLNRAWRLKIVTQIRALDRHIRRFQDDLGIAS